MTLGRIHAGTGKYDLAVQEFQRALQLDANNAEAYQQISRAYEYLGRSTEAENALNKAIALRPEYWDLHNSLGSFYYRQHDWAKAAKAFRNVIELTPDNSAAYSNLGVVLSHMDDKAGARRMYEKSIELSPTYNAYSNLAGIYYNAGEWGKAAAAYEKSLKLNDHDYRPWMGLAMAQWAAGDREKSRPPFTRALQLAEAESARNPQWGGDPSRRCDSLRAPRTGSRGPSKRIQRSRARAEQCQDPLSSRSSRRASWGQRARAGTFALLARSRFFVSFR